MALLLKGGRIVDPQTGLDAVLDMVIRDGCIVEIGEDLEIPKGTVIECGEKIVVPGLVDIHTHLREPGREDKETIQSGARAAAHGGYTAVCAMPNTDPISETGSHIRFIVERAAERAIVRVHPIGACTTGQSGSALAEIGDMVLAGAVAISDDGRGVQSAGMMRLVMDYAKQFGITVISHCEDESLVSKGVVNEGVVSTRLGLAGWPSAAEEIAVARDIALAELTGCRLHLAHLSTAGSVELVRAAKARGTAITAEVTPHHLFLDEDAITRTYDTNLKMNPPLRTAADRDALVAGLMDGTIDCIATDHAPHAPHDKALEFELAPFGTTGLETALSLVITHLIEPGHLDWSALVCTMAVAPREAIGLAPVRFEAGAVADITIIDPEARVEVTREFFESKSSNSAFLGGKLLGKATDVLVEGQFALRNGKVVDR
ncbi:MAG: dihydroorotase [Coriobacteriia bacterium]|nr:dihydroorotase [Coriobacteriia bacterium]